MSPVYDVVTVGGGLAGAGLGILLAREGLRVLVLERTLEFNDRVRGEVLVPWGVAEAKRLGLDGLLQPIGNVLRWWDIVLGGMPVVHRDIPATCLPQLPVLTYYHPEMQNGFLQAAEDAGVEVRRGARVVGVTPGRESVVTVQHEGGERRVRARLVVGADGRGSLVRGWGGFEVRRDRERRGFAGVLFEDVPAPEDTLFSAFLPGTGLMTYVFPQGNGRVRAYVGFQSDGSVRRFQGDADAPRFVETAIRIGAPAEWYAKARLAGPLASFDGTDEWAPHPYRDGIALVGDAASTSDPTWGQGMSIALRDLRLLRDQLLAGDDWDAAGQAYAAEHDRFYRETHTGDTWLTDLLLDVGPEADARRAQALPLIAQDPTRIVDTGIGGPEVVADEAARRRMFGEDG
jgi:2-polyprenyl-6-methoxyphenol hydroxylase-like FAD-dependent oxidoreductase